MRYLTILALALSGCASEKQSGASFDTGSWTEDDGGWTGGGDSGQPEVEDDFFSLAPSATTAWLFIANPDRDTLTRVAIPALQVVTVKVGDRPIQVATTADYQKAVTFNEGSDSVSVVQAESLAVAEVAVRPNMNRLSLSPDGRFALCWHDPDGDAVESSGDGARSYTEVSLVDTVALTHTPMVVGFNPRDVQFTADSAAAVVVSDAWLALIDLRQESPAPQRIAISEDLVDPPLAEEVLLAPDGSYALVRQYGARELVVVDLQSAFVQKIEVGANPTDLDITPDGRRAVAVARDDKELWLYDLGDPFAAPEVLALPSTESFGSVVMSPDGQRGLLYSTSSGQSRYGVWDLSTGEIEVRALVKPVAAMGLSPTGGTALAFHPKENGDTASTSPFYNRYALSMIDVEDDFFTNPLLLAAEPIGYAHSQDGQRGFFIMEKERWLVDLDYETLLFESLELKSDPVYVGVVPESRLAWVSQAHDLGRLSFYDPDDGTMQTLTGFELNSGIEY